MKFLTVLRHAKSSWGDPHLDDFDRPLNERGWKAARRMGGEFTRRGLHFDAVLASPAARVRETIDGLRDKFDFGAEIRFEPEIYAASEERLLQIIRAIPEDAQAALLVGHNPGLERLVVRLAREDDPLRDRVSEKFPTAACAQIGLAAEQWTDIEPGTGKIVALIIPKELD